MTKRRIVLTTLIILTTFSVITLTIFWHYFGYFISTSTDIATISSDYKNARIITGDNKLIRNQVIKATQIGTISDVRVVPSNSSADPTLAVIGAKGVLFLNVHGYIERVLEFHYPDSKRTLLNTLPRQIDLGPIEAVIPKDRDQIYGFLSDGSIYGVGFLGQDGIVQWQYGETELIGNVDIVSNGNLFVLSYSDDKGIDVIGQNGQLKKHLVNGYTRSVRAIDENENGVPRIAYGDDDRNLVIMDLDGNIAGKYKLPFSLIQFSLCRQPSKDGKQHGLAFDSGKTWLFDLEGNILATMDAPLSDKLYSLKGVWVRLNRDEEEYLAIVGSGFLRSMFYLYDSKGHLVYQELFAENSHSITTLPVPGTGKFDILIGTDTKVFRYSLPEVTSK